MKKSKILILWLLSLVFPFLFITNIKAYDFSNYRMFNSGYIGIYQSDTQVYQTHCTSATASCLISNYNLPLSTNTYNRLRLVLADNSGTIYHAGDIVRITMFFYQDPVNYVFNFNEDYSVGSLSYRSMSSWTSDVATIKDFKVTTPETNLYKLDFTIVVTSDLISGFNFRITWADYNSISDQEEFNIILDRHYNVSIVENGSGEIIDNQNQNTQDIIDNNNQNTQDIIDNNNQNTQAIIDSNKSCNQIDKASVNIDGKTLNNQGSLVYSDSDGVTDYIKILGGSIKVLTTQSNRAKNSCFYNVNKVLISCINTQNYTAGSVVTIPDNAYYFRASIHKVDNKPQFEICKNGSQAVTDAITDTTPPDTSELSEMAGWLPPGPVDSILTLPISLLNNLTSSLSGTCRPVDLPIPFINATIPLPCINTIYEEIGIQTFLNWVGGIASAFILFRYLMRLYKWVDDTLTLRENTQADWGGD